MMRQALSTGLLIIVLTGCGSRKEEQVHDAVSIQCWVEAPPRVRSGDTVQLRLNVLNTTPETIELPLGYVPPHTFIIVDAKGRKVWEWLYGGAREAILEMRTLGSGEHVAFEGTWAQQDTSGERLPPGTYFLEGMLYTDRPTPMKTSRIRLEILP